MTSTYNKEKFLAFAKYDRYLTFVINDWMKRAKPEDHDSYLEAIFNSNILDKPDLLELYNDFVGPTVDSTVVVEAVLNMIRLQTFANWYRRGNFDKWIRGNDNCPTVDQIKYELNEMIQEQLRKEHDRQTNRR